MLLILIRIVIYLCIKLLFFKYIIIIRKSRVSYFRLHRITILLSE